MSFSFNIKRITPQKPQASTFETDVRYIVPIQQEKEKYHELSAVLSANSTAALNSFKPISEFTQGDNKNGISNSAVRFYIKELPDLSKLNNWELRVMYGGGGICNIGTPSVSGSSITGLEKTYIAAGTSSLDVTVDQYNNRIKSNSSNNLNNNSAYKNYYFVYIRYERGKGWTYSTTLNDQSVTINDDRLPYVTSGLYVAISYAVPYPYYTYFKSW